MKKLNIIVPCYNEEENIRLFYDELMRTDAFFREKEVELSVTYIDDGSTDRTAVLVKELHATDERVHLISFSRNFGKESAIYAGLEAADGDYVAVMDSDLQDPPTLLPQMYMSIVNEGYDSVATRRVSRKGEPPIRSFFARQFYKLINRMSKTEVVDGARDFRMMTKEFANAVMKISEYNRFSKGIFSWVGFKTKWLEYENIERRAGETKWSFWKLFLYALDGIVAFTTAPLALSSFFGILFCLLALIFIIFIIIRKLIFGDPTAGWPSLVCIIMLVSGVQMFCIGIVGQYLAKTYMEVKNRPLYLKREEI